MNKTLNELTKELKKIVKKHDCNLIKETDKIYDDMHQILFSVVTECGIFDSIFIEKIINFTKKYNLHWYISDDNTYNDGYNTRIRIYHS